MLCKAKGAPYILGIKELSAEVSNTGPTALCVCLYVYSPGIQLYDIHPWLVGAIVCVCILQ